MDAQNKIKWYYTPVAIVASILIAGPFAIPLVWLSPAFKAWQKIMIILVLIVLTVWLTTFFMQTYETIMMQLKSIV